MSVKENAHNDMQPEFGFLKFYGLKNQLII
jgi:hypothetical protein